MITRRSLIVGGAGVLLAGCDTIAATPVAGELFDAGEAFQRRLQRLLTSRTALAPEYLPEQRSPIFRANGTRKPVGTDYQSHLDSRFADWRLRIDGLVAHPLTLSMAQLRAMPARTQITRHDCVEGWSAIGKWMGPRLSLLLDAAQLSDRARYLVFHCADVLYGRPYYESIDLVDARHPQTILAWALNDQVLQVANGAPLRLRVERQLGYKHAKYVHRIEAVESLAPIGAGKGGLWEDIAGYQWYAGI